MPLDEQEAFMDFYSGLKKADRDARYMLQRLASRPDMEEAWKMWGELKSSRVNASALTTLILATWLSAKIVKERKSGPTLLLPPLELAEQAIAVAVALRATHPTIRALNGITNATLAELDRVAAFFRQEAQQIANVVNFTRLPRKVRAHSAPQVAFVNCMCDYFWQRCKKRSYKLIAILTNVVFDLELDRQWDADRVKHSYRSGRQQMKR
jgi:hypothetical protein